LSRRKGADNAVKVLVFRSADPNYFISHVALAPVEDFRRDS
jgi:hypothetical protein